MKKVTIVCPCYNEEETIPKFFDAVDPILRDIEDFQFDFVLVNDGSSDGTLAAMQKEYSQRDNITFLSLSRNFGQNPALEAGLKEATGDFVITMDIDLQDNVSLIPQICAKFREGYDVVSPHRADRKKDSLLKRGMAKLFYKFINTIEGRKFLPENVDCYRGLSRKALEVLNSLPEKDVYEINNYAFLGFKTCIVDFSRPKRSGGKSKYSSQRLFLHALNVISSGTSNPLYWAITAGVILLCVSALSFIVLLVFVILGLNGILMAPESFLFLQLQLWMIVSLLLFFLSLILCAVGINGIYQHNILINTRQRPSYIIDSVARPADKKTSDK
jgi:glycosyltransferase involved in cell wall biosynthesis